MRSIIGHKEVRTQLARMATLATLPQSFLFAGPHHVGKRLVAEWFARELIGASASDMADTALPDLWVVEPEIVTTAKQHRERSISIEAVREIKRFLSLSPTQGRRRVVIIDKAEKLGSGAANALLKLLEEPPNQGTLILVTAQPESLLPTLLSRLFPAHFRPVSSEYLHETFSETKELPQFFFDLGLPGILVEAVRSPELFAGKKELLRNLFQISKLSLHARIALAEVLAKNELEARDILEVWSLGLVFQARTKDLKEARGRYLLMAEVLKTIHQLDQGEGSPRGALEKLLIHFP